ncbi:MAG: WG repeat-containing protein [Clostridia bacterium]|nr:WG repeat-containing protein [Clostridia bacterium]
MAKIDPVSQYIRESFLDSSPIAEAAAGRALKRIKRREAINRLACVLLPVASILLILFLLIPGGVQAPKDDILSSPTSSPAAQPQPPEAGTVFVSEDDPYYHAFEDCAGITGETEPLMERVARLSGKYACAVCCEFETKKPLVEAMSIGDILILRYEDEYLYEPELTGVFGFSYPTSLEGEDALLKVSKYLHAKRYIDFINSACQNKSASLLARTPGILYLFPGETASDINDPYQASLKYPDQKELSSRYIASSHYALYFPDFKTEKTISAYGRVNGIELTLQMDGDIVRSTDSFTMQTIEDIASFDVRRIDEESLRHSSEAGDLPYSVYHTQNEYVLVLKEKHADPYLLENVTLRIGETEFTVNGYMDLSGDWEALDEQCAVYALILTEKEADDIINGADIALEHLNFARIASESGYAYTPVQYGTGAYGVMDASGEFVIAPEYENAWSYQDLSGLNAIGVTGPIILKDYAGTIYLYDGETLDEIAWYSMDGANSIGYAFPRSKRNSFNISSSGIYEFRRDEGVYLLSHTGEVLMSFLYDESGNYENNLYYSPTFLHETVGYPDRIVLYEQKGSYVPDRMWIADLNGNRISRDFERLIPLTWSESGALFITVTYDRELAEKNFYLPYYEKGLPFSGYETDPSFRLGLVDQNGNEVAECKYIALEIIEDLLYLTEENGEKRMIELIH